VTIVAVTTLAYSMNDEPLETTEGGIQGVQLVDVPWLKGDWEPVHPGHERMRIEWKAKGHYVAKRDGSEDQLIVFQYECTRFVEWRQEGGLSLYCRLNGHSERASFDPLPAVLPGAWSDPKVLAALDLPEGQPVPAARRREALAYFAAQIDTVGTLMHQDFTYFRPGVHE
jgi:hypothetical protein